MAVRGDQMAEPVPEPRPPAADTVVMGLVMSVAMGMIVLVLAVVSVLRCALHTPHRGSRNPLQPLPT